MCSFQITDFGFSWNMRENQMILLISTHCSMFVDLTLQLTWLWMMFYSIISLWALECMVICQFCDVHSWYCIIIKVISVFLLFLCPSECYWFVELVCCRGAKELLFELRCCRWVHGQKGSKHRNVTGLWIR